MDLFVSFVGVILSIVSFWLGYRQTIGAKKERIRIGNLEVVQVLLRRLSQEEFVPSITDVSRLLEGKARDHRVKVWDFYSEAQIMNSLYIRVLETDFLSETERGKMMQRILPVLKEVETRLLYDGVRANSNKKERYISKLLTMLILAVVTSLLGSMSAIIPTLELEMLDFRSLSSTLVSTLLASLAVVVTVVTYINFKDSQQKISEDVRESVPEFTHLFEHEVLSLLQKYELELPRKYRSTGYDFVGQLGDQKILFQVIRGTPTNISHSWLMTICSQIRTSMSDVGADKGVVISDLRINPARAKELGDDISFMTLGQLRDFLNTRWGEKKR